MHDLTRTVVAVATPAGRGGIGCIRISGPDASAIGERIFRPGARASTPDRPRFGTFLARDGKPLDHGYLVRFAEGASFTGESTVELWCHGSPPVLGELLHAAVEAGAAPAEPGEFTYRALRNGRLDLARAEAVRDLIDARTAYQARVALAQVEGELSRRLAPLREGLEDWIARAEAAVEFVDESETDLARAALGGGLDTLEADGRRLLAEFRAGRVVREGARVVLIGRPNVGKSSLFNALLAQERAIVTDIAGTTRDTIEEELDLDGIPVRLVDTAGLRDAADPVEREGVRRAETAGREADLRILVLDATRDPDAGELEAATGDGTLVVANKSDLEPRGPLSALPVSARTGAGTLTLREKISERLGVSREQQADPVLTNARHADSLRRCLAGITRASAAFADGLSEELVLEDLRESILHLAEITGEYGTEDLYDRIFTTFCLGK